MTPSASATDAAPSPLEFVKNGKRTGFDIELIEAMAKTMGKKVQWVDIDFKGLIPGLIANRFDVAASGIYMTDERRKVVDFTDPYYKVASLSWCARTTRRSRRPRSRRQKVTVQVGTKSVAFLKDNYPKVQRVEVEKNQEMFDLVNIGRADAAVTGRPLPWSTQRYSLTCVYSTRGLARNCTASRCRKDETALTAEMNKALQTLRANGTYDALATKWFGKQ